VRDGSLDPAAREKALAGLRELAEAWTEGMRAVVVGDAEGTVATIGPVRQRALRLLSVHALRSTDALQLAAALVVTEDQPSGHSLVSSDPAFAQRRNAKGSPSSVESGDGRRPVDERGA